MFVNGDTFMIVIKLLTGGLLLLCLALASHVVWIVRLSRSRALDELGPAARIAFLALAAATPVMSFYFIGMMCRLRRHARDLNPIGAGRKMLGIVGAFATLILGLVAIAHPHQPASGPYGADEFSRLLGMILVLAIPCAILGMACQVLARSNQARAGLIIVAGSTAICLFLLV